MCQQRAMIRLLPGALLSLPSSVCMMTFSIFISLTSPPPNDSRRHQNWPLRLLSKLSKVKVTEPNSPNQLVKINRSENREMCHRTIAAKTRMTQGRARWRMLNYIPCVLKHVPLAAVGQAQRLYTRRHTSAHITQTL